MNGKVTNIELAEYFGISRQAISMLVARGIISKNSDGLFDLKQATQSYTSNLRDAAAGRAHETSQAKTESLRAGANLKSVQVELAQNRLRREMKETVSKGEVIEALERLTLNTRQCILTLPQRITTELRLDIDAQEKITVHVHDVLTELAKGCFTVHEAVAYKQKPFSELTTDEFLAMSYAMLSNRTYLTDAEKRCLIDEMIDEAECDAAIAVPIPVRNGAGGQQ
jgi:phage terminase Nu1 subunit (DNA packaging protein)